MISTKNLPAGKDLYTYLAAELFQTAFPTPAMRETVKRQAHALAYSPKTFTVADVLHALRTTKTGDLK